MAKYGAKDYYDECCYGHYGDDQLLDVTNSTTTEKAFFGPSNTEILTRLDARSSSYSMPYVYNDFSWDHCDEDFDSLVSALYDSNVLGLDVEPNPEVVFA
jgi:hypothetical protein